jgi:hypothetical protein
MSSVAPTPDLNDASHAPDANSLPADTISFANRMFDAAREGNSELLLQAVDAGLPPNLTNSKGTFISVVQYPKT